MNDFDRGYIWGKELDVYDILKSIADYNPELTWADAIDGTLMSLKVIFCDDPEYNTRVPIDVQVYLTEFCEKMHDRLRNTTVYKRGPATKEAEE